MESQSSVRNSGDLILYQLEQSASFLDLSKVSGISPTHFQLLLMEQLAESLELLPLKTAVAGDIFVIFLRSQSFIFTRHNVHNIRFMTPLQDNIIST